MTLNTCLPVHLSVFRSSLGVAAVCVLVAACGGGQAQEGAPPGGPGGGPPMAMDVEVTTLTAKPVERTTEYIATVKSRRSTTIQPQVDGFITSIAARPGQRVAAGTVLMTIDSGRQEAAVASLESLRAARAADVQWARQQEARHKKLLDAGAVSQQEYEQSSIAVQTSEAQLKAVEAQIREQRVELGYYQVTAPKAGIVGDIPVRVGDRVSSQTELTTLDENAGLELYLNVPATQAADLRMGTPVRIVDDRGQPVTTTSVNFIAPSVDTDTQSVLAKAPLQTSGQYRPDQFVRTHVVWSSAPGLTVPLVAVTRINGQYFVFVVENGDGGATIARQRAVQLGPVVGNDYVVLSGLKEGERLVVGGIQKIGDGVAVKAVAAQQAAPAGVPARGTAEGK
jgi:RND family efflux transporter MFP subunit